MTYAALKWGHLRWFLKSQFLVKIYVLLNEYFLDKIKTSNTKLLNINYECMTFSLKQGQKLEHVNQLMHPLW